MKSAVMLIAITLLPSTVVAQTMAQSSGDPEIRSVIADCQRRGWSVRVTLESGETLIGKRVKTAQDSFQITVGKEVKTIAYSDVRGAGSYFPESNTVGSRLGRGLEASVGYAALATVVAVSYPTTKLAERRANAQAKSLKKEIAAGLPQGAGKTQVIDFLTSRKLGHEEAGTAKSVLSSQNQANTNLVRALVRCHNGFSFYAYYVEIIFRFDGADRLLDYTVEVTADGP